MKINRFYRKKINLNNDDESNSVDCVDSVNSVDSFISRVTTK